jgi:hypothetical protein
LDQSLGGVGHGTPPVLAPHLCKVGGLNQNYVSASRTQYHVQIEDRGPLIDRVSESPVRRVNLIIYANYGEPNARIVYGHDYDWDDIRTPDYNRQIEERIKELSYAAREIIDEREARMVERIKGLIRRYYHTKDEGAKKEFEEANALHPFLFSRAWVELKKEREERAQSKATVAPSPVPDVLGAGVPTPDDVLYPLDPELRERVIEIERLISDIAGGVEKLRARGAADDILVQTCRKLVLRAREIIAGREPSEITTRRLDNTRQSLLTTWRQIQFRLKDH